MFETYRDLKYSLRILRKNSGFAAVVVITLALGIGANTAIFSFVNAVILNPLPFPESSRLLVMSETTREGEQMSVSLLNFQDWRARAKSFEEIGGVRSVSFNLTGVEVPPQRLSGQAVTPNFFRILGVQPQLGRVFTEEDDKYGIPASVLISDSLWRTTFGTDPNIIGKRLDLGLTQFTVIGVLPAGFEFMRKSDVWAPLGGWLKPNSAWFDRGNHMGILALGRLKSGATQAGAETEIRQIAAQLEKEYPATNTGNGAFTRSLQTAVVHEVSSMLLVLMGAVGFVLLIACVNVANLSLARSAMRTQEIGIRMALGAGRGRLMQQLFTENLLLALLGGLVGILTARWLLNALLALAPADLPRLDSVSINGTVLLFTAALTLLTSLLFGLLPTWQATRGDQFMAFNQSGRSSTASPGRRRLFDSLMVAETALALVLLTGAGLMTRTIYKLAQVHPGFRPDHLLTMRFDLVGPKYDDNTERQQAFLRDASQRLKALPGVDSAAFTLSLPIQGSEWGSVFIVGDQPVPERSQIPSAAFNPISPGYLETMGIGLRRGRLFTDADGPNAPTVVVINETMARRFWPNEDPIGKRLKQGWPEWKTPWREVVGVVADVKLNGVVEETPLHVYLPLAQSGETGNLSLVLRTKADPASMTAAAQAALHTVDKDLPLYQVRTMDDVFKRSILPQRAAMVLLSGFALLAILLAAVGIYGVISWGVVQRTREMGLRMALGAQQRDVLWLILRRNMLLVFAGVVLGLGGAIALTRVLASLLTQTGIGKTPLLFGVKAVDPVTFVVVPLLLSIVALLACCLPARRATKVDPMVVLRYE
jgi:putative ABC transport system permease protein